MPEARGARSTRPINIPGPLLPSKILKARKQGRRAASSLLTSRREDERAQQRPPAGGARPRGAPHAASAAPRNGGRLPFSTARHAPHAPPPRRRARKPQS